jgi:hypothetical protein
MNKIFENIVPLAFLAIAALLIYLDRDGWGWCFLLALLSMR